jgi:hypothetical protein
MTDEINIGDLVRDKDSSASIGIVIDKDKMINVYWVDSQGGFSHWHYKNYLEIVSQAIKK